MEGQKKEVAETMEGLGSKIAKLGAKVDRVLAALERSDADAVLAKLMSKLIKMNLSKRAMTEDGRLWAETVRSHRRRAARRDRHAATG